MKFWDSSAVIPTFLREATTERLNRLLAADAGLIVWWGTGLECMSAIARRERDGDLAPSQAADALRRLIQLEAEWREVPPSPQVRENARRMLRLHPLRAADALQLAAALAVAGTDPSGVGFVTLDQRLAEAAAREGFTVVA